MQGCNQGGVECLKSSPLSQKAYPSFEQKTPLPLTQRPSKCTKLLTCIPKDLNVFGMEKLYQAINRTRNLPRALTRAELRKIMMMFLTIPNLRIPWLLSPKIRHLIAFQNAFIHCSVKVQDSCPCTPINLIFHNDYSNYFSNQGGKNQHHEQPIPVLDQLVRKI